MFESSIVSYGENGRDNRYGSSSYRGNTDAGIIKDFLDYCAMKYKREVKSCSDYMAGSFTTRDVCIERGIDGVWTDLSCGFNMLLDSCPIPDNPETIFWHPPYSSLVQIQYSGMQWDDREFIKKFGYDPKPYDLSRMDWEQFMKALNYCCIKMYSALETGGRMGILCGDIRRKGTYHTMLEIAKPGQIDSIVIKRQVHTSSSFKKYGNNLSFIPIEQEYFLILKKVMPYMLDYSYTAKAKLDIRDSENATWKDVVFAVMTNLGGEADLTSIYSEIENYKRCQKNPHHWREKVRQTLSRGNYISNGKGYWQIAA